jgi:hypothetical protein
VRIALLLRKASVGRPLSREDRICAWSKHIDTTVAKMGRSLSIIKPCSTFLTALSTKQVLQALVLSHLDHCSVVWSGATKFWAQNRAARLALGCTHSTNMNYMHVNLSWLKVEERLTSLHLHLSHLADALIQSDHYLREILICLKYRAVCLTTTQLRHPCIPHKIPPEVSSQSPSPEQTMGGTQYYIES